MKKSLFLFVTILLLVAPMSWAQCTGETPCPQLARVSIAGGGGGVPVVTGETEETCTTPCVFSSTWSGTDVTNSDGGTGHVWTGEVDTSNKYSLDTSSVGWHGEGHCSKWSGTTDNYGYVYYTHSTTNNSTGTIRFAYKLVTGPSDGNYDFIFWGWYNSASDVILRIKLTNTSGTYTLDFSYLNDSYTMVSMGTYDIQQNTWYQILLGWERNTVGGAKWAIHPENGGSVLGSGNAGAGTTYSMYIGGVAVGSMGGQWVNMVEYWDIVRFHTGTTTYPDLRTY